QSGTVGRRHVVAACGEAFLKDELRHFHSGSVLGLLDPVIPGISITRICKRLSSTPDSFKRAVEQEFAL
ncbi:MAG: hypothetical protein ACK5PS_18420, partial [Desulfopila sp.]